MQDENQIVVPPSFIALFVDARKRLTATREHLAARYDLCEDMATMLVEHCRTIHFRDGVDEGEVLRRCLLGLHAASETVDAKEAVWVVRRVAELLQWPALEPAGDR